MPLATPAPRPPLRDPQLARPNSIFAIRKPLARSSHTATRPKHTSVDVTHSHTDSHTPTHTHTHSLTHLSIHTSGAEQFSLLPRCYFCLCFILLLHLLYTFVRSIVRSFACLILHPVRFVSYSLVSFSCSSPRCAPFIDGSYCSLGVCAPHPLPFCALRVPCQL